MAEIIYPQLSYDIQGACFDVHNALRRFDLSEAGWETALAIALNGRGIAAHRQVELALHYKKWRVGRFFVDVIAEREDKVLLELKRVRHSQRIMCLSVEGERTDEVSASQIAPA